MKEDKIKLGIELHRCDECKQKVADREWINTNETLPDEDVRVLVYLERQDDLRLDTDRIHNNRWVRWGEEVTHWQLLPEPPTDIEVKNA